MQSIIEPSQIDLTHAFVKDESFVAALDERNRMLKLIANTSIDLLSVQDANDEFVFASDTAQQLFGWSPHQLIAHSFYYFLHPDDALRVASERVKHGDGVEIRTRYRFRCRSSDYRWVESRSRMSTSPPYVVTIIRDIQDEIHELHEWQRNATYDALTNVLNRRASELALYAELERSLRHCKPMSIAFFDIDRFKYINDSYGHGAGDLVLKEVTHCVERGKRHYDVLGRWGGDEFLLILPETRGEDAVQIVERIRNQVFQDLPGVTLSFGISSNDDAHTPAEILLHADAALYGVKRSGGNQIHRWTNGNPIEIK